MILWKCCTQYASKFGKLSSGHRTGKGQFSFQTPRKAVPNNAQTIAQLNSSHTLAKVMLKILQARLQQYVNHELPDVQAGFRKSRGTRDQIANIRWIIEKAREFQKNIYFGFIDYAKVFDCGSQQTVEYLCRWGLFYFLSRPFFGLCSYKFISILDPSIYTSYSYFLY